MTPSACQRRCVRAAGRGFDSFDHPLPATVAYYSFQVGKFVCADDSTTFPPLPPGRHKYPYLFILQLMKFTSRWVFHLLKSRAVQLYKTILSVTTGGFVVPDGARE